MAPRPTRREIEEQLSRILDSKTLRNSTNPCRLLAYVVSAALAERVPNETDVAAGAFGKDSAGFDSRIDQSVRTAAKNLRGKLTEYYAGPGAADRIIISVPKGGYTATFTYGGKSVGLTAPNGFPATFQAVGSVQLSVSVANELASEIDEIRNCVNSHQFALAVQFAANLTLGALDESILRKLNLLLGAIDDSALGSDLSDTRKALVARISIRLADLAPQDLHFRYLACAFILHSAAAYSNRNNWRSALELLTEFQLRQRTSLELPFRFFNGSNCGDLIQHLLVARMHALFELGTSDELRKAVADFNWDDWSKPTDVVKAHALEMCYREYLGDVEKAAHKRNLIFQRTALSGAEKRTALECLIASVSMLGDRKKLYSLPISTFEMLLNSPILDDRDFLLHRVAISHKYIEYLRRMKRFDSAIDHYKTLVDGYGDKLSEEAIPQFVWAGTEAVRVLHEAERCAEGNKLTESLQVTFGANASSEVKRALAWAVVKGSWCSSILHDHWGSAQYCATWIERWREDEDLTYPTVFLRARHLTHLRRAQRLREALDACNAFLNEYGATQDPEIDHEVAYALVEKAYIHRFARNFSAARLAHAEFRKRFAGNLRAEIVDEETSLIHHEGDLLISEAKLSLNNEMTEDAKLKLAQACDLLSEAARRASHSAGHLRCWGHALFLLGDREGAREKFINALKIDDKCFDSEDWRDSAVITSSKDLDLVAYLDQLQEEWHTRPSESCSESPQGTGTASFATPT